jgi:hypothetical protein
LGVNSIYFCFEGDPMNSAALAALSAAEVLERFKTKSVTPSDYLAACLEQISRFNPKINALTALNAEHAVSEASRATLRWQAGTPKGPLDGLPIGVKDLQDTKGLLTTHGSIRARGNVPDQDLPMVARLRAAGAIILAKTNVPELGAGGNSRNPVWGATGNPFDPDLIAGGSSGGSAGRAGGQSSAALYRFRHRRVAATAGGALRNRRLSPVCRCHRTPNAAIGLVRYFGVGTHGAHDGRSDPDAEHLSGA